MADEIQASVETHRGVHHEHSINGLVAGKEVKMVVDGVEVATYTVPSGYVFNGEIMLRGQEVAE